MAVMGWGLEELSTFGGNIAIKLKANQFIITIGILKIQSIILIDILASLGNQMNPIFIIDLLLRVRHGLLEQRVVGWQIFFVLIFSVGVHTQLEIRLSIGKCLQHFISCRQIHTLGNRVFVCQNHLLFKLLALLLPQLSRVIASLRWFKYVLRGIFRYYYLWLLLEVRGRDA